MLAAHSSHSFPCICSPDFQNLKLIIMGWSVFEILKISATLSLSIVLVETENLTEVAPGLATAESLSNVMIPSLATALLVPVIELTLEFEASIMN